MARQWGAARANRPVIQAQLRFINVLATLLAAGFSLQDALLYWQQTAPSQQQWPEVQTALQRGERLNVVLEHLGFHAVIVTQVSLAAQHGELAAALRQAGEYLTLQHQHRDRLRQALFYPLILLSILAVMQVVLVVAVLPRLSLTEGFRVPLALWLDAGVVVVGVVSAVLWSRLSPLLRFRVLHALPGVRRVVVINYQFHFTSGAAAFLAAGRPITDYCRALAEVSDPVLAQIGQQVTSGVQNGQALREVLNQELVYRPLQQLTELGQTTAFMATATRVLTTELLQASEVATQRLLALVQPLLFGWVGLQIVLLYTELLLPLYSQIGGIS